MIIYKITNLINDKQYVGQTKGSIKKRWNDHCFSKRKNNAITAAIKKYGKENFSVEIIATVNDMEELNKLEKFYIEELNTLAPNGYNLKTGGQKHNRYTKVSRQKMSQAKIGTTILQEVKDKMSDAHKQRFKDTPSLKIERSEMVQKAWQQGEYRNKISEARTKYWSDPENKKKASKRAKQMAQNPDYINKVSTGVKKAYKHGTLRENLKKTMQKYNKKVIDSNGIIYESIKKAASENNIPSSSIVKCIQGKYKSAGKLTWEYYIDRPTVYMLIGAPASGKSWVANQLLDKYEYISYDNIRKKYHINLLLAPTDKPKLYDPTFKISTMIRRHPEINFVIVCIQESEGALKERMALRSGKWTDTVMKRNEQVRKRYEKYGNGGFIGTAQEVLDFLKSQ